MNSSQLIDVMMVIDDDAVDQYLMKTVIDQSGLVSNLLTFSLATDALDFLLANPRTVVDIILLDIKMPLMDGFEFLEATTIQLNRPFTKAVVVMLSSFDKRGRTQASQFSIVKNIIEKPLRIEDLHEMTKI